MIGDKTMSVDDCWPNYIIDNGEKLLGNNNYPAISYSGETAEVVTNDSECAVDLRLVANVTRQQ